MIAANKKRLIIFLMFMVILVDMLSYSIIFPVMPALFYTQHGLIESAFASEHFRNIWYGITLAIGPLGVFLGPPIIGKLSDRVGRKKIIVICLVLGTLLYFFTVLCVYNHWLIPFVMARFMLGLTAGNFAAAQTVILDVSTVEKDKVKNIGWISLATYIALIVGPAIAGFVVDLFNELWTPFLAVGICQGILIIFVLLFLEDSFKASEEPFELSFKELILSFTMIFTDKRIMSLTFIFLFFQFGFTHYMQGINIVMSNKFGLGTAALGYFWCIAAVGGIISQVVIQPLILERCPLKVLVRVVAIMLIVLTILSILITDVYMQYVIAFCFFIFELVFYNSIVAKISHRVSRDEQGQVMGGITAIYGISGSITAVMLGFFLNISIMMPLMVGILFLMVMTILVFNVKYDN